MRKKENLPSRSSRSSLSSTWAAGGAFCAADEVEDMISPFSSSMLIKCSVRVGLSEYGSKSDDRAWDGISGELVEVKLKEETRAMWGKSKLERFGMWGTVKIYCSSL